MSFRFFAFVRQRAGLIAGLALMVFGFVDPAGAQGADTLTLSLGEAARMAAENTLDVKAAAYRVDQRIARFDQARAGLYPRVSAEIGETARTFNTASFGLSFPSVADQPPLFDPDGEVHGPVYLLDVRARLQADLINVARWRRIEEANTGIETARSAAALVAEESAVRAAVVYVAAAEAVALRRARETDRANAEEGLHVARRQLEAGVALALDVTRAEVRLATVNAQLVAAANNERQTRLDLQRALGLPAEATFAFRLTENAMAALPADTVAGFDTALARRADLAAARQHETAINASIASIKAERYPSLRVVADEGLIGLRPAALLNTYDLGISLVVPVFDGFNVRHRIEEQQAALREAQTNREELQDAIRFALRKAQFTVANAEDQLMAAQIRLNLAEQEIHQAQRQFETGIASNADLIAASLGLGDARTQLVAAQTNLETAHLRLAVIQGTLTDLP
ncbi:MAG: TolC family protein [Rhodothermales bacterium]